MGQINGRFISRMERVLHLYSLDYDPAYPVWCFDERPCFLIGDRIAPLPMKTGQVKNTTLMKKMVRVACSWRSNP